MAIGQPLVFELLDLVAERALTIRVITPMRDIATIFEDGYREIASMLAAQSLFPAGTPFPHYYNWDKDAADVEFGFPVPSAAFGSGRVLVTATPSGKAASSLCTGSWEKIGPTYDLLAKWAADNGYIPSGESFDIYLDNPDTTPSGQLRTRLNLLLREV